MLLFVIGYTGFFLLLKGPGGGWYETRIFAPMFVPITLIAFIAAEIIFRPFHTYFSQKKANILWAAVVVVWLIYPAKQTMIILDQQLNQGAGYTDRHWRNSQTFQYLFQHQALEAGCTLYTDDTAAIYFLANRIVKPLPPMFGYKLTASDASKLEGTWPEENNACLVLFYKNRQQYTGTINQIRLIANTTLIAHLEDGAIYSVARK